MRDDAPKLMFVEEDPVLSDVTAFRLELLGYHVETAATAEDALEKLGSFHPNLMIIDLVLPNISGIELIERLTSDQATSDIAIMALSIEADLEAVQRAYTAGATDYLVAPYDPAVLEDKVEQLLAKTKEKA